MEVSEQIAVLPDTDPADRQTALTVRSFGMTDQGRVRESNEDQFVNAQLSRAIQLQQSSLPQPKTLLGDQHGHLFLVADGMGGHAGGEHASALALLTIEDFVLNTLKWFFGLHGEDILGEFQQALRNADARMFEESSRRPELKGMATTVTMGYSTHAALYVVHVGDSRCYLLRGGKLQQITRDHTLAAEMVRGNALSPDEAEHSPFKNVVTNSVGGSTPGLKPEVHKVPLEPGDVALFCSDGLTGPVTDEDIAAVLQSASDPEAACRELVARANAAGGRDNITVIVACFDAAAT
ncbi:MAG: stp 4 [Myxococcales bacterium]|nr:stp 4 [Myxococcales bacterium]